MKDAVVSSRFSRLLRSLAAILRSPRFFWFTVGLLVVQALWIACTGRYPMAFDENFHLGIIRIYAHHLSPFLAGQPPDANAYGAVARDPSYLYQYLMSFPYRLISLFTHDQTIQVICLRFINIALFASGLPFYRRLLQKTGASRALVNLSLLIFVLLPIAPLLAAQINYDNLFLPVCAASLLLTVRVVKDLQRSQIKLTTWLELAITCLLASLVKYAFLPVFIAIIGILAQQLIRHFGLGKPLLKSVRAAVREAPFGRTIVLAVVLLLSLTLFMQRYAVNTIDYHTPIPDCSKVLSVEACSAYGPWIRNFNDTIAKFNAPRSPLTFSADWFYGMWLRTFFAVDGPNSNFQTHGPFFLPAVSAIVYGVGGVILVGRYGRRLWRRYDGTVLAVSLITSLTYIFFLWFDDYHSFLQTGQPVAINGRYLLPVLPPIILVLSLAYSEWLHGRPRLKGVLAAILIICLVWGGGALTYILRSNDAWYWPSQPVRDANHVVQHVLGPITPGNADKKAFLK